MSSRSVLMTFLIVSCSACIGVVIAEEGSYIASVVEYSPITATTSSVTRAEAQLIMQENLDAYEEYIIHAQESALRQGKPLQLIVFPENGLFGEQFSSKEELQPYLEFIPEPVPLSAGSDPSATPCDFPEERAAASPALVRASCLARHANVTLVLAMGEVVPCSGEERCPDEGHFQYSTQIALAENGQLIGKYRQSHIFYETQFDEAYPPEIRYFDASFGVRFGMMLSSDIMFQLPQLALYELGIRDFTWSAWWQNNPALITANQLEVARSAQLPSNFLASGIGRSWYCSGSGLFSAGQPLKGWYNPSAYPESQVLVAEVPFLAPPHAFDGANENVSPVDEKTQLFLRDERFFEDALESSACEGHCCGCGQELMEMVTFWATTGFSETFIATSRDLSCAVTVEVAQESDLGPEQYGVAAITGMYKSLFPVQICALVHCGGGECAEYSLEADTEFASWSIQANVTSSDLFIMYPLVAENYARIPPPSAYQYSVLSADIPFMESSPGKATTLLNAALFGLNRHIRMGNATNDYPFPSKDVLYSPQAWQ